MKRPVTLVTAGEIARRFRLCDETLKRQIRRAGIVPDAVLVARGRQYPCFVRSRAAGIIRALATQPEIIATATVTAP
jgi:hypothetical protein